MPSKNHVVILSVNNCITHIFVIMGRKLRMIKNAKYWIEKLHLSELHDEGGYFKESSRSDKIVQLESNGDRSLSSAIYYLLDGKQGQFSAFHKLGCDEMWHFYDGSSLTLYIINDNADLSAIKLGNNMENGEYLQILVKAGSWFGATVNDQSSYTLVGCTCSPAFDYRDFELAKRKELDEMYPQHKLIIEKLTRS